MNFEDKLKNYAKVVIERGINVQKGMPLVINTSTEAMDFVRQLTELAYDRGASEVIVRIHDDECDRMSAMMMSEEAIKHAPEWKLDMMLDFAERKAGFLSVIAPNPSLMKDVSPERLMLMRSVNANLMKPFQKYTMNDINPWCVVAVPSKAFKRADGFVFGLYRAFNTHINSIDIAFESVYYDEPVYELFTSKGLNATFDNGKTGLYEIDEPIDIAIGIKYPKNEFVNAPYEDMDYEDYRNEELMRTQITRIDRPGISEIVLKGLIAVALLAFLIVGFLMTKNQRFRNKFRIKKKYEEKEKSGKTFDINDIDEYIYLIYQFYDIKEDKIASYLGVDEADKLVEEKLTSSYEVLLKKGYIEKEDSDYSVALTKKGRLKLEEILIKKEYLLSQDNISDEEEKFLRLFR